MAPKFKDGDVVVTISGKWVSWVHTAAAYTAFLLALFTGLYLHYHKIVQNEYYVRTAWTAGKPEKIELTNTRAILKNGFPLSHLQLAIAIPSDQSSSCLLQLPPVSSPY